MGPAGAAVSAAFALAVCVAPGADAAAPVRSAVLSAATSSAIRIGVTEWDEGPSNQGAAMAPGLKGGTYYVNQVLGGVHGHPITAVVCNTDATTSLEVDCANKFVSDGVVAVFDDGDPGFSAEKPILSRAGLPIFGVQALDPPDDDSTVPFFFGPPEESYAAGPLQVFHKLGLNKLSLTIVNTPAYVQYVQLEIVPVAKKLGMQVSVSYYDGTSTNWSVEAATLLSSNPQLTGIIAGPEGNCTSLLTALRNAGFTGPILMGSCSAYVTAEPKDAVGTYSYSGGWLPELKSVAPAVTQKQITAYDSAMTHVGDGDTATLGQWAVNTFAGLADLQGVLAKSNGPYTSAAILSDLKAVKDFQSFMGPVDTCNHKEWPGTSSCNHDLLLLKVVSGGNYKTVQPGGFVPLDPSILP